MIMRAPAVRANTIGRANRRLWTEAASRFSVPLLLRLVLLGIIAAIPVCASAIEPARPNQQFFLKRAVFAEGRLWALSEAGDLSSVTEGQDARVTEALAERAFDLCVRNGHPVVITGADGGSEWTLWQHSDGVWSAAAVIAPGGDRLLAMNCAASRVTLLTTRRLIEFDGNEQRAVPLSGTLGRGSVSATHATSDQFFVGLSAGEWGGGLRRIDRRTGSVTVVERNLSGKLCGGPLNTACDPVNGIAVEPWKPDCILVAVGLVHFRPHGRIVEVCGDQVQGFFDKPYGDTRSAAGNTDGEPFGTVAFFELVGEGDTLWATGIDGIYEIGPAGAGRMVPLPHFTDVGGIRVSFEMPHLVFVLTSVDQRRSMSGPVPLVVPR